MTITSTALLQREAIQILSQLDSKPIIAVDLDYTVREYCLIASINYIAPNLYCIFVCPQLWPAICAEHTVGPYQKCPHDGTEASKKMSMNSLFCTDKRTSAARLLSLFPQVREVLEFCLDNSVIVTICSRSTDKTVIQEILTAFEMWDWFFLPQIFPQRKVNHFCNLVEQANLEFTDFLLFDDDPNNIRLCTQMGVSGCLVGKSSGLNWSKFVKGLKTFQYNAQARKSLQQWVVAHSKPNSVASTVASHVSHHSSASHGSRASHASRGSHASHAAEGAGNMRRVTSNSSFEVPYYGDEDRQVKHVRLPVHEPEFDDAEQSEN